MIVLIPPKHALNPFAIDQLPHYIALLHFLWWIIFLEYIQCNEVFLRWFQRAPLGVLHVHLGSWAKRHIWSHHTWIGRANFDVFASLSLSFGQCWYICLECTVYSTHVDTSLHHLIIMLYLIIVPLKCTIVPLYCTNVPVPPYHCTTVPYHCTVPLYRTTVPSYRTSLRSYLEVCFFNIPFFFNKEH